MRVCDIVCDVDESDVFSIIIGKGTGSKKSHVALLTENNEVVEAVFPRVIKTDFEKWKKKNAHRKYEFSEWYDCNIDLNDYISKKYELGRYVNYLFYKITGWEWFINRDNSKKVVCSELNGLARGLPNAHKLTPNDFAKFIKKEAKLF